MKIFNLYTARKIAIDLLIFHECRGMGLVILSESLVAVNSLEARVNLDKMLSQELERLQKLNGYFADGEFLLRGMARYSDSGEIIAVREEEISWKKMG